jgi:hypothetical protein
MKSIGVSREGKHLPADIVVPSLDLLEPDAFEKLYQSSLAEFGDRAATSNDEINDLSRLSKNQLEFTSRHLSRTDELRTD